MHMNNETIAIKPTDRIELDITSITYYENLGRTYPTFLRLDWGWEEFQAIGEEKRNGYLVFTKKRLTGAIRAFLAGKLNCPIKSFSCTWDIYHIVK